MSAADSSMVRCRSDHPDEFIVPLDDPNEEIAEEWQDGLRDWYICRNDQCPVKSTRISSGVSQRRSSSNFCSCLKRRSLSVSTNSQISTALECDFHSALGGTVVVPPQKPSVVAWFQRCFPVSHLFGVPSPRKVESTNRTYFPENSRVATNGTSVVGKLATTARMMSLCADGGSNVFFGPLNSSVCGHSSRGSIAQSRQYGTACSKNMSGESCGLGTARWTRDESRGSVRTEQTCRNAEQKITISSGVCCRFGS